MIGGVLLIMNDLVDAGVGNLLARLIFGGHSTVSELERFGTAKLNPLY